MIVDRKEGDYFVGRTEGDSYEVDDEVLITAVESLKVGEFYQVEITDAENFDLFGILAES